jgi:hypothetical protein
MRGGEEAAQRPAWPAPVFCSYAHEDQAFRRKLEESLAIPRRADGIDSCKSLESFYNSAPPVKIQVDAGYLRCWRGVTVPGFRSPGELRR